MSIGWDCCERQWWITDDRHLVLQCMGRAEIGKAARDSRGSQRLTSLYFLGRARASTSKLYRQEPTGVAWSAQTIPPNMAAMLEFRTRGFNPYAVKYSPYYDNRVAVASAANFGIVGNGRLFALGLTAAGIQVEKT